MPSDIVLAGLTMTADEWRALDEDTRAALLALADPDEPYDRDELRGALVLA